MNEKIKELIEECTFDDHMCSGTPRYWFDKKLFAEQIVQECVRYFCEDYSRNFDVPWRADLARGIYKHFGVER